MAKRRDIEITIAADGRVQVHVKGMPGKQCLELKDILQQVVGTVDSHRLTPEYYETQTETRISLEQR